MIAPMLGLVLLTLTIGLVTLSARVVQFNKRKVSIKYFRNMQGDSIPDSIILTTRCFNNLFEVPVLFYIVSVLFIVLGMETPSSIVIAYLFLFLRILHAIVHLTYNHILHRALLFWVSFLLVIALWIMLMLSLP